MQTGQDLQLTNGDPFAHNVNVQSVRNRPVNWNVPAGGQPFVEQFAVDEVAPVRVTDTMYPWMGAWVVVRPNPDAAVTQPDGSFEMPGVPVGEVELQLWLEKAGWLTGVITPRGNADAKGRLKVEVKAAGTDLGAITIDADSFNR